MVKGCRRCLDNVEDYWKCLDGGHHLKFDLVRDYLKVFPWRSPCIKLTRVGDNPVCLNFREDRFNG